MASLADWNRLPGEDADADVACSRAGGADLADGVVECTPFMATDEFKDVFKDACSEERSRAERAWFRHTFNPAGVGPWLERVRQLREGRRGRRRPDGVPDGWPGSETWTSERHALSAAETKARHPICPNTGAEAGRQKRACA